MGFTPTATAIVTHPRAFLCYEIQPSLASCPCKADLVTTTLYWLKHQSGHQPLRRTWLWTAHWTAHCGHLCSLLATSPTGERQALGILNIQAAKGPGSTICGEMTIIKVFLFTHRLLL